LVETIESRLLAARSVRMALTIQHVRADEIQVKGSFAASPPNTVRMDLTATLRGQQVPIFLDANGAQAKGGLRTTQFEQGVPPTLRTDVLKTFARKGLSQMVMDLLAGSAPQAADGGDEWIRVARFTLGNSHRSPTGAIQTVNFDVMMDDAEIGRGSMWVAATGLPVLRTVYVRKPTELVVIERYDELEIES
jgi:hypothetical protein